MLGRYGLATALLGLYIQFVSSAGVLVHIEVLRRGTYTYGLPQLEDDSRKAALDRLPIADWLDAYSSFSQSGSFFPDWGYGCLESDGDAEIAHWPPFLGAAVNYLIETYPEIDSSTSAQQLLSFILAVASHQSTDASWHSIRFKDGLLRMMADLDFDGDYEAAHSILDIGGDTILAKEYAFESSSDGFAHLSSSWSVPVRDIVGIYQRLGISINTLKLRYCMTRGFAAVSALRKIGSTLATQYASKSPFMTTQLEDYFLGSIQEASTSVIGCWASIESWVHNGSVPTGDGLWDLCEPMRTVGKRGKAGPYVRASTEDVESSDHASWTQSDLFKDYADMIEQEFKHVRLDEDDSTGILTIRSRHEPLTWADRVHASIHLPHQSASVPYFLTPNLPYAEFGTSLALVASNTTWELVVGSPKDTDSSMTPSRGAAYVIPIGNDVLESEKTKIGTKQIRSAQSTMPGYLATASQDVQITLADSRSDATDHFRSLYFGRSVVNASLHGFQCVAILSSDKIEIFRMINESMEVVPYITILDSRMRHPYSSAPIASRLVSFEREGFPILAVLSPSSGYHLQGAVHLFSLNDFVPGELDLGAASITIVPTQAQENIRLLRLGTSLAYSEKHDILFIGQAGSRSVLGYKMTNRGKACVKLFELSDPSSQDLDTAFGHAILSVNDLLYVASPTEDLGDHPQAGIVRVFRMSPLYKKNSRQSTAPWVIRLIRSITPREVEAFSHFGMVLSVSHNAGGVYISVPNYANRGALFYAAPIFPVHLTIPSKTRRTGLMALMDALPSRPRIPRKNKLSSYNITLSPCLIGYDTNSRFGASIVVSDNGMVAIGAPTEAGLGQYDRKAGKVYLYDSLQCS